LFHFFLLLDVKSNTSKYSIEEKNYKDNFQIFLGSKEEMMPSKKQLCIHLWKLQNC